MRALEQILREIARSLREVPEDRIRLLQVATVVDLEHRGRTRRVFPGEVVGQRVAAENVDGHALVGLFELCEQ